MSRLPAESVSLERRAEASAQEEVAPEFQRECVDFFADLVEALGLPRSIGQIYGLLFSSPRPLSFTDIAESLDISRGSASQGLQALRELGAVRNVSSPEHRRELFEPELELRKLVSGALREKVEPIVTEGGTRIKRLRDLAGSAATPAGKKFSKERMQKLESWRRQMGLLLPILKTILGPGRA